MKKRSQCLTIPPVGERSRPASPEGRGLSDVLRLSAVRRPSDDGGYLVGLSCSPKEPAMEVRGVGYVQGVLEGLMESAGKVHATPHRGIASPSSFEGMGEPLRLFVRRAPNPDVAILLDGGDPVGLPPFAPAFAT